MSIPKCSFCGQLYATTALLNSHIQQNHTQKSQSDQVFTCRLCNQVLQTKETLLEHLSLFHREERQITCKMCNQICADYYNLKQHLKQVHPKEQGQNQQIAERLSYPIQQNNQPHPQVLKQTNNPSKLGTTHVCYTYEDPEALLQQMQTYFNLTREQIINGKYSTSVLKSGLLKISMFMKNEFKDQIISIFTPDPKIEKPQKEQVEYNQINAPSLPIKQQLFVNNTTYYPTSPVQNRQITPPVIYTQSTPSNQWKITIPLSTAAQGLPQQLYQYLLQTIGNISVIQLLPDQSIIIQCTISNYSNVIKVVQVIQVYGQSIKYNVERM
ncbi:transcription_factor hamlet-like [Hexamita inflata]|uniref:Transcription factor hamlet-like n=1 Tax=Hexamita inflata TaxID=28002 RepID=A0AA86UQU7_9EUKA|nr:transcription factor hamlet-like [Hexamita inflata]CAI9964434.1 transcription factor hamlet-like [Hexamita inflata]